jgi:hypothetical protein
MRRKIMIPLVCMILIMVAVTPMVGTTTAPDPIVVSLMWIQDPDPGGWDVNATESMILADDFECLMTGLIVGITLWGSWTENVVGDITNIHLSIHEDIPDPDGPGPLYSKPGIELWSYDTLPHTTTEQISSPQYWYNPHVPDWNFDDHDRWFSYEITIPDADAFLQELGNIYWLDVQVTTINGIWGWKTTEGWWNDDAVWGDWDGGNPDLIEWHELRNPETDESLDMGFGLFTKELPGPPTVTVDIAPGVIRTSGTVSKGNRWVTAYLEFNDSFIVKNIVASSVLLEDAIPPELNPKYGFVKSEEGYIVDHDGDGILERMLKFDRSELEDMLSPGSYNLKLSGHLFDGTKFSGLSNSVRVKGSGK